LGGSVERYRGLRRVYLFSSAEAAPFEIERVWLHRGRLIFKFRGVDSISQAERLQGAEVRVPRAERAEAPPGEYYHSDLAGCEVVERGTGERLGVVAGWQECGAAALLEVERAGTEEPLLVPFARAICVEIDLQARRILVELPEGLKELNSP
jgi:16S rRNA processing protein RimM